MKTLSKLLSVAAIVASGTYATTSPAFHVSSERHSIAVQQQIDERREIDRVMRAQTAKPTAHWVTISNEPQQNMHVTVQTQRWVF
ncbi:hypothetical protein ACX0MV_01355 [Pseudomonas borbori]